MTATEYLPCNIRPAYAGESRSRDKYGRTCLDLTVNHYTVAAMVTLPKSYREQYGMTHMVNDRTAPMLFIDGRLQSRSREFTSRKAALAYAQGIQARALAAAEDNRTDPRGLPVYKTTV